MRVEYIDDMTIRLHHERISYHMDVWTTPHANGMWYWNLDRAPIIGRDNNMVVAIEKAMTALDKLATD